MPYIWLSNGLTLNLEVGYTLPLRGLINNSSLPAMARHISPFLCPCAAITTHRYLPEAMHDVAALAGQEQLGDTCPGRTFGPIQAGTTVLQGCIFLRQLCARKSPGFPSVLLSLPTSADASSYISSSQQPLLSLPATPAIPAQILRSFFYRLQCKPISFIFMPSRAKLADINSCSGQPWSRAPPAHVMGPRAINHGWTMDQYDDDFDPQWSGLGTIPCWAPNICRSSPFD
jgi:hypothetical protein